MLHFSRLYHVLFSEAPAKTESSGMENDWRCVMFDRLLTKSWPVSSPAKLGSFLSYFSPKEYERDILKHDWKRWAFKGFRQRSFLVYKTRGHRRRRHSKRHGLFRLRIILRTFTATTTTGMEEMNKTS
ncbi:hypothetical protein BYT27DRAFT_6703166 [Phlegmacium glaucopus]|nr:hypothetical protein BYT27DRAFT_6703166 [Phlegmacium glaucopus]